MFAARLHLPQSLVVHLSGGMQLKALVVSMDCLVNVYLQIQKLVAVVVHLDLLNLYHQVAVKVALMKAALCIPMVTHVVRVIAP